MIVPDLDEAVFTVVCHVSACLNGISGIIFCSAPPAISATWFPPQERVTATSVGQMFNGFGNGAAYLIARLLVPSDTSHLAAELRHYLLFLAAPPVLFFLCVLVYFPSAPPRPPSVSATEVRPISSRRLVT